MNKGYLNAAEQAMQGMNYDGHGQNYGGNKENSNAGGFILTFTIQRVSANIAGAIPVALFAPALSGDGYNRYLAEDFGAAVGGITVFTTLFYANTQSNALLPSFYFTYSDGVLTDDVRIEITEGSYKQFQSNLLVDKFFISELQFVVPSTGDIAQFNESVKFKSDSGYARFGGNSFTPNMFKDSREQDSLRVHVNRFGTHMKTPRIDRETGMIVKMRQNSFIYSMIVTAGRTERM